MTSQIKHRLKISRGHMDKVISMVENDEYCINIVHQIQAVEAALKSARINILENHLKNCVVGSIKKGDTKKVISELVEVINKS